ncbi:MAG: hypothetical protein AABX47_06355 [Nanoarchaeota archaeon]
MITLFGQTLFIWAGIFAFALFYASDIIMLARTRFARYHNILAVMAMILGLIHVGLILLGKIFNVWI